VKILGVDPGLGGALAVISEDNGRIQFVEVIDTPTEGEDARREVSPLVLNFIQRHAPAAAYVERGQAMPTDGGSSAFQFGKAYGAIRMAIKGCLVPLTTIESRAWKTALALPSRPRSEYRQAKEDSRQKALELFPEGAEALARVMDHGRAEACLIAYYGMMLAGYRPAIAAAS